jgi:hypothetical protein
LSKILPLLSALSLCTAVTASAPSQEARQQKLIAVSPTANIAGISLASENGDTTALVVRDTADDSIWVRVSNGTGLEWSAPIQLDDDISGASKRSSKHSVHVDQDRIFAAWYDERNGANADIYFQSSNDGGATWLASDKRLDDGFAKGARDASDFRLSSSGNDVVALIASKDVDHSLYLTYSKDGGATWKSALAATNHNTFADVDDIAIACSDDVAYIVWRDNFLNGVDDTVWLSTFDLTTETFTAQDVNVSPNLITSNGDADDGVGVAVDLNFLAILYHADNLPGTAEQVRVNFSTDLGQTWSGDQQVGQYDNVAANHDADNGTLLVEDGHVAVAWQDDRSGMDQVYTTYADLLTGVYAPDHQCSNGILDTGPPQLAGEFHGEPLAVAWTEAPGRVLKAQYLRDWMWSSVFTVSNNVGDVSNARLSWNDTYDNFSIFWLADNAGVAEAFIGGFRAHQLNTGTVTAGTSATFALLGFTPVHNFQVVASGSTAKLLLPDGRDIGLAFDFILQTTRSMPALSGVTSATGTATTAVVTIPPTMSGNTIYMAAASFTNGGNFLDLTDVVAVEVQ